MGGWRDGALAVLVGEGWGILGVRSPGCSSGRFMGLLETQAWVWCQLFKETRMERAASAWGDV